MTAHRVSLSLTFHIFCEFRLWIRLNVECENDSSLPFHDFLYVLRRALFLAPL